MAEQSEFQKEAFGKEQAQLLDELKKDSTERKESLDHEISFANEEREKKHAEEEAAREAAEAAQREAEEAARRAEQKPRRLPVVRSRKPSKLHPPTKCQLHRYPAIRWTTTLVAAPTVATTQ